MSKASHICTPYAARRRRIPRCQNAWGLDFVWFERRMYVRHVMARSRAPDIGRYVRSVHTRAHNLRGWAGSQKR